MNNKHTFEAIPFTHLEQVAGGVATKKKTTATSTQSAQEDLPGNLIKGCLTGAAGGIFGGPHGAAIGCAVGAGKSLLDSFGSQLGVPSTSTGSKKQQ